MNEKKDIPIDAILIKSIDTIAKVDDFKNKILMNYYLSPPSICTCGNKFSAMHMIDECPIPKGWTFYLKVRNRTPSHYDPTSPNYVYSWILNWCIWKTTNESINKNMTIYFVKYYSYNTSFSFITNIFTSNIIFWLTFFILKRL